MARARRFVLGTLATVVLLVTAVAGAIGLWLDEARIARFIEQQVTEATGRPFELGRLDIDWGWETTRFSAGQVTLANPEWAATPTMLSADRAALSVDVGALLHGELRFPQLSLSGARVSLLRTEQGRVNWSLGPEPKAGPGAPVSRAELPAIGAVLLSDVMIAYRDRALDSDRMIILQQARLAQAEDLNLTADGSLDGLPLHLQASGAPLERLRSPDAPYPFQAELIVNETRLVADGALTRASAARSFTAQMRLTGPDLGRLFPIAGIPAPPSAPFRINGRVRRAGSEWRLADLDMQVGESDLHGSIGIDLGPHPPVVVGSLTAQRIDPKDVGLFLAEGDETTVLPRARIAESRLRGIGMDLQVRVGTLETPMLPLHDVRLDASLNDGRLLIQPFEVGVADGSVHGLLRADGVGIPGLGWDLELHGIHVGQVLPEKEAVDTTRLVIGGSTRFSGRGETVAAAIGNGDGRVELIGTGGRLDRILVEAADLDLGEILVHLGEQRTTPVRCAVAVLDIDNGIARVETLVVDTRDSVITVDGLINLRSEVFNLEVDARAKDPSLLTLSQPVKIQGPFNRPRIEPVGSPVANVIGAAALGILFTPAAALIPFIEAGDADPAACRELIAAARD